MLLGGALRLHGLASLPLNFDEGATGYFAHQPFATLWGAPAALEMNPPLFYSVERCAVLLFGDGQAVLRLASAVAGTLAIGLAGLIAARIGGRLAGVVAALFVALSATCIQCSQDARCYAVLTACVLGAMLAEMRLMQQMQAEWRRPLAVHVSIWVSYVLCSIAALYLHNTAVLIVAALNFAAVFVWFTTGRPLRFAALWIGANGIVAAAYAVWLPMVAQQAVHALADFWLPTPSLADLRYAMMNVYALPTLHVLQPMADSAVIGAGLVGVAVYWRDRSVAALAVAALLGVPVLSWAISQWRPIMNGKTLLWLAPLFLVFVALGCTRWRRIALPATAAMLILQAAAYAQFDASRPDEAYPEVAALLRGSVQPGDAIFLDPPSSAILLDIYGWPRGTLRIYAQPGTDPWYRALGGRFIDAARLAGLHEARLWVLTRAKADVHRRIEGELSGGMRPVVHQVFGHGRLRGMVPRNLELSLFVARP